jgi:hypothetical protein
MGITYIIDIMDITDIKTSQTSRKSQIPQTSLIADFTEITDITDICHIMGVFLEYNIVVWLRKLFLCTGITCQLIPKFLGSEVVSPRNVDNEKTSIVEKFWYWSENLFGQELRAMCNPFKQISIADIKST